MSGKRVLDAARLLGAARNIAKTHAEIRSEQWKVFTQTSQLAKAVKSQTDRFTVTAGAAYQLARRLNERESAHRPGFTTDPAPGDVAADTTPTAQVVPLDAVQVDEPIQHSPLERQQEALTKNIDAEVLATRDSQAASHDILVNDVHASTLQPEQAIASKDALPDGTIPLTQTQLELVKLKVVADSNSVIPATPPSGSVAESEHDSVPDGVNLDIFHTARGASLMGKSSPRDERRNKYEQLLRDAKRARANITAAQEKRSVTSTDVDLGPPTPEPTTPDTGAHVPVLDQARAAEPFIQPRQPDVSTDVPAAPEERSKTLHQSRVPSSRLGRFWQYSGLATSMAFGALGESARRVVGGGEAGSSLMLSEANMNRLVAKLSRMRGAALKLGQMMSFQDSKMLPPAIHQVLSRVQDSADYMPAPQRDEVLANNLGLEWRELFSEFADTPIAAASIGQVHRAKLASSGQEVAVKIQYPGVRDSIDSDLSNLSLLLTASRLLPKGLFLDKTIANARTELAWECDYVREAECGKRFATLLADESDTFTVPKVFDEACGPQVLTAEFMSGVGVTKATNLTQDDRDWIGSQILRLCLRELMEWRFMQTDPNWTNFLFDRPANTSRKLRLLDFGASRDFPEEFVTPYVQTLIAASQDDRARCRELSIQLGYLTGAESKEMLEAHVTSIMTLAEPFLESTTSLDEQGRYDFQNQTITDRVRANIGLMMRERLAPPPEETYSLHRKLSGAYLLCARLGSRVPAKALFIDAVAKWQNARASGT